MVGFKLKDFQEKCVEELLEQTVFGEKKEILIQAPTGSGKSNTAMNLSFKLIKNCSDINKILYSICVKAVFCMGFTKK